MVPVAAVVVVAEGRLGDGTLELDGGFVGDGTFEVAGAFVDAGALEGIAVLVGAGALGADPMLVAPGMLVGVEPPPHPAAAKSSAHRAIHAARVDFLIRLSISQG